MGNQSSTNCEISAIYTKNYVSFIRDSLKIIQYCETSLTNKDKEGIISLLIKIQQSDPKNAETDMKLYTTLLKIRRETLMRYFEGSLLSRQSLVYTLHEYKYLQECINSPKKIFSQSEVSQIIQTLQHSKEEDSYFLAELEKHVVSDKQGWTFFEDTFFRGNSYQVIHLNDYHKYLVQQANEYSANLTLQWPSCQRDLHKIKKNTSAAAPVSWIQQDNRVENLVFTIEEFWILHKIFVKNAHKISYISQIPSTTLNLNTYLQNLTYVREIQISSLLDQKSQRELLQFLQDNPLLEKLSANLESPINTSVISVLQNHPHLQYISLQVNAIEKSIKQIRKLKRIMVKPELLYNIEDMVDPTNVTLQFEIKNMRFTPQTIQIINKFPIVFLTCNTNFYCLAQTIFRDLSAEDQINLMKFFINTNKITIDSLLNFQQNEDLMRMNNGTLDLGFRGGYLYLFMTKLLVDFERELMTETMKIAAFELLISPYQCFDPHKIHNDLFFA